MSGYRPSGLHWRLKHDLIQPETFQYAQDPDVQREKIQLWLSRSGFAVCSLTLAVVFSLTVRDWITDKLVTANDYLGFSSPFAPGANLPSIGLVPRWTVVLSAAVLAASIGFARRGKSLNYGIATISVGSWWLLSSSARWLIGLGLVIGSVGWRRVSAARLR